ncbi:MAG: outer membrane beta-barrel protein [Bacteroidia bacterium]
MKKLLFILFSLVIIPSIHAQESPKETPALYQKGRLMLGVSNLDFGYSKTLRDADGNVLSGGLNLGANLRTGMFVKDRWMLGLDLGYHGFTNRRVDINYHSLSATAFSRYYSPISQKLSFFTELNAGYNLNFQSNQSGTWGNNGNFSVGADVGLAYLLNKRFSVEAAMGYRLTVGSNSAALFRAGPRLGINFHF